MANPQLVEQVALGVGEKGELDTEVIAQRLARFGRVNADRKYLNPAIDNLLVVVFELDQLGATEGSPIAAVKDVEGPVSCVDSVGSCGVGEGVAT